MKDLELQFDDHTIIVVDYSTDRDITGKTYVEIDSLAMVTYIGDIDYDVTKALSPRELDRFQSWAIEQIIERGIDQ